MSDREQTPTPTDSWDAVTFEGADRAHLRAGLAATPAQRLQWLEEALQFARNAAAAKKSY